MNENEWKKHNAMGHSGRNSLPIRGGLYVFSRAITLKDEVPTVISGTETEYGYREDIDLRGHYLDVFLKPVFERGIIDGTTTILVECPPFVGGGTALTQAQIKALSVRPYWVHVPTSCIIGWKTKID